MSTPICLTVRAALALAVALSVGAVAGDESGQGPRIRFEGGTHDFGKMESAEKKTHAWVFHNDGDRPLRIVGTRTSCGCTASVASADEIAPGGRGTLEVSFDASGQYGTVRKTITVITNDPVQPRLILTIRAEVEATPRARDDGGHPPIAGRSLLMGDCAPCHAEPAAGKSGRELYDAVCALCHGATGGGEQGRAPSLLHGGYLGSRSDEELRVGIAYGTANPRMPGFSEMMGGPLTEQQVESLVRLLRSWDSGNPPRGP